MLLTAAVGLAVLLSWRTGPAQLPWQPSSRQLFIRCSDVAGLAAGDPVQAGGVTVGKVSDLSLLAGGVLVTCELQPFPELTMPVRAVIGDAGGSRRMVVLTGAPGAGEALRPRAVLPGSTDINLPGELAPLLLP